MKKILAGFLGLLMVTAVVGGTAYALFSSTATVTGVTFAAGNADLRVWDGDSYESTWAPTNFSFSNMYPGYSTTGSSIWLRNNSTAAIALDLKVQAAFTSSEELRYAAQVRFEDVSGGTTTSWTSLNQILSAPLSLTGGSLPYNSDRQYMMYVRVPLTYEDGWPGSEVGNEIAGDSVAPVTFTFTGTQVAP